MQKLVTILKVVILIICLMPLLSGLLDLLFLVLELCHKGLATGFLKAWPLIFYAPKHPVIWPLYLFCSTYISVNLLTIVQEQRNSIIGFIAFLFGIFFMFSMFNQEFTESMFMWLRWWGIPILFFGGIFFNTFCTILRGEVPEGYEVESCGGGYDGERSTRGTVYEEWDSSDRFKRDYEKNRREREEFEADLARKHEDILEENRRKEQLKEERRHTIAYCRCQGNNICVYGMDRNLLFSRPGFRGFASGNTVIIDCRMSGNRIRHTVYDGYGRQISSFMD